MGRSIYIFEPCTLFTEFVINSMRDISILANEFRTLLRHGPSNQRAQYLSNLAPI